MARHSKQHTQRLPHALTTFAARALATAIAALVLVLTPAIAQAAFKAATTSPMSIGTYAIPAPATATWTHSCAGNGRSYTLNLTGYGKVSKADSYRVIITAPDGTTSTPQTITSDTLTLTQTSTRRGTYTFTIQALVGTWTGTAFTGTNTC
ncbi:hypothetical protein [Pseudarthrobacter cellobiosi]|uniref:hypothetical protein n=1 Tax=Pseudarthrobacter cellobiosi TaxID=2953654 RepID=UPI00208E3E7F|nr:hypothetical protein [Pseudarthrobacter sp. HLT1-5]MCO4256692.1 hypothetical protein [Pseudarthrobacter sp. HLT1-5]